MNILKVLKYLGILVGAIIVVVLLFVLYIWGSITYNRYDKEKKAVVYQKKVCDTIKVINEKFEVALYGFTPTELKNVNFYVMGEGRVKQQKALETIGKPLVNDSDVVSPITRFLRTDTIVVRVAGRFYLLNEYSYSARYNYGMTGPVDPCFCDALGFGKLNNKPLVDPRIVLQKKEGYTHYMLPNK
jgi:hypothetical protein